MRSGRRMETPTATRTPRMRQHRYEAGKDLRDGTERLLLQLCRGFVYKGERRRCRAGKGAVCVVFSLVNVFLWERRASHKADGAKWEKDKFAVFGCKRTNGMVYFWCTHQK